MAIGPIFSFILIYKVLIKGDEYDDNDNENEDLYIIGAVCVSVCLWRKSDLLSYLCCHGGWWDLYMIGAVCLTAASPEFALHHSVATPWVESLENDDDDFIYNRCNCNENSAPNDNHFSSSNWNYQQLKKYDIVVCINTWVEDNLISLRTERRRRKAKREKFTHKNCTLPTIHRGPAGRRPAWA